MFFLENSRVIYKMMRRLSDLLNNGRSKADALALASLIGCVMDHLQMVAGNATIAGEAKSDLTFLFNNCKSFLRKLRANPETAAEVDEFMKRDNLAFAAIFQAITTMKPEQVQAVEQFALGVASGEVGVELGEGGILSITFLNQ